MNFQRGQKLMVTDYQGREHEKVVWEDDGTLVFITSDEGLREMNLGNRSVWPIGVSKTAVRPAESERTISRP